MEASEKWIEAVSEKITGVLASERKAMTLQELPEVERKWRIAELTFEKDKYDMWRHWVDSMSDEDIRWLMDRVAEPDAREAKMRAYWAMLAHVGERDRYRRSGLGVTNSSKGLELESGSDREMVSPYIQNT